MRKFLVWLLSLCYVFVTAQNKFFYHRFTTDDGLPNNTIYDIKESPDGIIALGTDNGLTFFNGQNFKSLNIQDGLDKPFIIALRYLKNGDLLIGNYIGKLQKLSRGKITNLPTDCETVDEVIFHNQQFFIKSYDANYNLHTKGTTLGIIFRKIYGVHSVENLVLDYNNLYKHLNPSFNGYIADVPISANNNDEPITITHRVVRTKNYSVKIPDEIPSVFKVILKNQNLLLFTNLFCFEINSSGKIVSKIQLPYPIINSSHRFHINLDHSNRIWLNLQKKGLFILEENRWIKVNEWLGLKDSQNINNLYCDSKNRMWIGTHENGMYCIPNANLRLFFTNSYENFFNSFFIYNNNLYTCNRFEFLKITKNGLIKKNVPIKNEFSLGTIEHTPVFNGVSPDLNNAFIFEDIKGYLDKKAIRLKDGKIVTFGGKEIRVLENGKTKYISLKDPKQEKYYHIIEYPNEWLCNVGNRLFFATIKNDTLFEKRSFPLKPKEFISEVVQKNDTLYIAAGNKIYLYKNEKLIQTVSEIKGIKLDIVNKISFLKNDVWIATVNGLFRWSKQKSMLLNKYNLLPDNDVQSIHFQNNFLFVTTKNGLAKIPEALIHRKSETPFIKIRKALVDGRDIRLNSNLIEMKSGDNTIKLIPEIINYQSAKNQILDFCLDEGEWQRTNNIELLSFPYGNHSITTRIRDVNSDWNYFSVKVQKEYPFYMTFGFWILILSIAVLLTYYFFNQKIKRIRKKTEEDIAINNKMVELRQSALSAMMNPHFVFNSLNAIQYFVNTRQNELSGEYLAKLARLVRLFLNQSSEPYISLKDEISRLKMYVELEQLRFYPFEFNIELNNIPDPEKIRIPNMMIQPFIENAIIHGISHLQEKDGQIALNVKLTGEQLTIEISDNGFGLQENQNISNHISKGVAIIKQRLKALSHLYPDKIFQLREKPFAINEIRKGHLVILTITLV
ncbi:histidine kinase [Chryseobacterium sp. PS-8]|uniref:Histidine kinase n=1 Tax=Chryseobacterium indicum TaxID=2766954 RepID=A0ABS9C9Z7_9FLAO|nr:histidine kinase [Chryseobacterium sp. PS-8]MCF2221002.1 histidine kinase [Chryseobacterium sp. PS-8]